MACRSHLVWGLPFFRIGRPDSLQDGARRSAGLSFEPHAPEVSLLALGPGARVGVDHGDLVARVQYPAADLYLCSFYWTARPFLLDCSSFFFATVKKDEQSRSLPMFFLLDCSSFFTVAKKKNPRP